MARTRRNAQAEVRQVPSWIPDGELLARSWSGWGNTQVDEASAAFIMPEMPEPKKVKENVYVFPLFLEVVPKVRVITYVQVQVLKAGPLAKVTIWTQSMDGPVYKVWKGNNGIYARPPEERYESTIPGRTYGTDPRYWTLTRWVGDVNKQIAVAVVEKLGNLGLLRETESAETKSEDVPY